MKKNLWKVTFTSVFSSSMGMDRYTGNPETRTRYVVTEKADLEDVRKEIEAGLGRQTQLTRIETAEWLGEVMNHDVFTPRASNPIFTVQGIKPLEVGGKSDS